MRDNEEPGHGEKIVKGSRASFDALDLDKGTKELYCIRWNMDCGGMSIVRHITIQARWKMGVFLNIVEDRLVEGGRLVLLEGMACRHN